MGNRLRALRLRRGWTHEEAAEAMGISRSQFIKLERGERRLTESYISRAAKAFKVPAAEILEEPSSESIDHRIKLLPPDISNLLYDQVDAVVSAAERRARDREKKQ